MPKTNLLLYQEADGTCPVDDWLQELRGSNVKAYVDCRAKIERLAKDGHDLRRPTADFLQDGIYELRAKRGHVNYRILYFFHGKNVAVLAPHERAGDPCRRPQASHRPEEGVPRQPSPTHAPEGADTMKAAKTKTTSDARKILGRDDDPEIRAAIDEQVVRSQIAEMVLAAREARKLTQAALARLLGTRQSVISRIEDADDSGSITVATLTRLFSVLRMSLSIQAVPSPRRRSVVGTRG